MNEVTYPTIFNLREILNAYKYLIEIIAFSTNGESSSEIHCIIKETIIN